LVLNRAAQKKGERRGKGKIWRTRKKGCPKNGKNKTDDRRAHAAVDHELWDEVYLLVHPYPLDILLREKKARLGKKGLESSNTISLM